MSEIARMVVDAAERIFGETSHTPPSGPDNNEAWRRVEEAGLDRLLLPEDLGGVGDAADAAVQVALSFGARNTAIPFVETLVANRILWKAGAEVDPGPKTVALPVSSGAVKWAIEGIPVVCADGAVIRANDAFAGTTQRDLASEPVRWLTPEWTTRCLSAPHSGALALYATLKAASIAGALQTALEMTLRYVNERVQFGRKIGTFQAIQHLVARVAEETAAATAAVQLAGRCLGGPNELYFAAVAKSRAGEAATLAAAMAHQCHGAIGYTRDYSLHRFTTRALASHDDAGSEQYWNEQIGRAALANAEGRLWPLVVDGTHI